MKLLVTIITRGKGEEIASLVSKYKVNYSIIMLGAGTATSSMLDYFSLANTDKDVVFSLIDESDEETVLKQLDIDFDFSRKPIGMAFTVDLTSMNRLAYQKLMAKGESL